MVQTLKATKITLGDLAEQFGLTQTSEPQFFQEWQVASEEISTVETQRLGQVKSNFSYLLQKPPFLEEAVKMVVLSPLLELAGFYQPPFWLRTEVGAEISSVDEDDGTVIKGKIDVVVVSEKFWVLVIESKMSNFSLTAAPPQTLSYMLTSPQPECFGMIANGSDFVFLKLNREGTPTYSTSKVFSLLAPGNELMDVLRVLKHLGKELC